MFVTREAPTGSGQSSDDVYEGRGLDLGLVMGRSERIRKDEDDADASTCCDRQGVFNILFDDGIYVCSISISLYALYNYGSVDAPI